MDAKRVETPTGTEAPRLDAIPALAYVVAERAPAYRAIMAVFAAAKKRYVIQMRPAEVLSELRRAGHVIEIPKEGIENLLDALADWGNLRRNHDTATARTLEEFQRRRAIYVLTAEGEAAEQAIGRVVEAMERSGSLQKVMFGAILDKLRKIESASVDSPDDSARLYPLFSELYSDFGALTENASIFLSSIQQALETDTYDAEVYRAYKVAVIEYLERFIDELDRQEEAIQTALRSVEARGIESLIRVAARETEVPRPDGKVASELNILLQRWAGVRTWFLGDSRQRPLAEGLRAAATGAITRMLRMLNLLNEQRFRRVSRVADFLQLARWFAAMSDQEAHILYKDAFGLEGPRHILQLPEEDDATTGASWFRSPAVTVPWALQAKARPTRAGRPGLREDFGEAKRQLEVARKEREARLADALRVFVGRGRLEASELPILSRDAMETLLDYLDASLTAGAARAGRVEARSHDGRYVITFELDTATRIVEIESDDGALSARNFFITVQEATA